MNEFKILNGYEVKDEEARNMLSKIGTFSTEESLTGQKWIDDKPIYRKVINFGPLFDNIVDLEKQVAHGITFDTIVKFDGFCRARPTSESSGYYNIRNIPVVRTSVSVDDTDPDNPSYNTLSITSHIDNTYIHVDRVTSGLTDTLGTAYFIIEYTKPDIE